MFFGFLIASPLLVFASWFPYELDPRTAVSTVTLGSKYQANGYTHGAWCGHGGQDHSGLRIESDSHAYNTKRPQVGTPCQLLRPLAHQQQTRVALAGFKTRMHIAWD